jgi:hypothetical protein
MIGCVILGQSTIRAGALQLFTENSWVDFLKGVFHGVTVVRF